MQTDFAPARLGEPAIAAANAELRRCVHCGFCTATCPTFVLRGDELDSPRGRITLIRDMLQSDAPPSPKAVVHIDRCLSCLACVTTCPSGVNYRVLIDQARIHIQEHHKRDLPDRLIRALLARVLSDRRLFRAALTLAALRPAAFARPLARLLPTRPVWAQRARAMLALAPKTLPRAEKTARIHPAIGPRRGRVALLEGCAQSVLAPRINDATIRLLNRLGIEVVLAGTGCCGALTHHMGREAQARASATQAILAWMAEIQGEGLDAIIVTASGCGSVMKDYDALFRTSDPVLQNTSRVIQSRTTDIAEYLHLVGYTPTRIPQPVRVAYQSACSLQHGQQITDLPIMLLQRAGFEVATPAESHLCCGSAGTYNILQPELAAGLRTRKQQHLADTKCDIVASGNIGCITQLTEPSMPVVHVVELLDWMAGGPAPPPICHLPGVDAAPLPEHSP